MIAFWAAHRAELATLFSQHVALVFVSTIAAMSSHEYLSVRPLGSNICFGMI